MSRSWSSKDLILEGTAFHAGAVGIYFTAELPSILPNGQYIERRSRISCRRSETLLRMLASGIGPAF